ncbi:MAG: hypothetical protein QGG61_08215 [Arenicellales bacterium]|nr:hypothetical protein [Arenicellales bacterium]
MAYIARDIPPVIMVIPVFIVLTGLILSRLKIFECLPPWGDGCDRLLEGECHAPHFQAPSVIMIMVQNELLR